MRFPRTSIAGMMGVVLVAALALVALRSGSPVWAGATSLAARGILSLAVVGAVCRQGRERAWWLGFSLFGWSYLGTPFLIWMSAPGRGLPTELLLNAMAPQFGPPVQPGWMGGGIDWMGRLAYGQAGHSLIGLVAAPVGGLLSLALFGAPSQRAGGSDVEAPPEHRLRRAWYRRPVIAGLVGFASACGIALFGLGRAPGISAAAAFFLTWGLLALAIVGAIFGAGAHRAAWLGAALFGIGYMSLAFRQDRRPEGQPEWPLSATDRVLYAFRAYFPWVVRETPDTFDVPGSNDRILEALRRPIPKTLPDEMPLGDLVQAIRDATRDNNGHGMPIHVDQIGLQEAEVSLGSPVRIDPEGAPLRTSLRLALKPLDLTYEVGDGVLTITRNYDDRVAPPSIRTDPFLVVGHCLLALLAAGLGGMLAPLVCGPRRQGKDRAPGLSGP